MNLQHLKYAVEVEKTRSFTKAADNLYMGQPNLSKAVRELEKAVGFDIFMRSSKGVYPTKQGSLFLNYAESILMQISEMETLYSGGKKGKLTFSISVPRASYISYAFTMFLAENLEDKDTNINYLETNLQATISGVLSSEYNLGVVRFQKQYEQYYLDLVKNRGLVCEEIAEFSCSALMSKDGYLAGYDVVNEEDLKGYVELLHGDISNPMIKQNKSLVDYNKSGHKKIYIYERGSQFDILNMAKNTYILVSKVPKETLERYNLVEVKCDIKSNRFKDILIQKENYNQRVLDKKFIKILKEVWAELSQEGN
ncbi:MAG: LysR family transcriptional regulator [Clostridia bacterium]